MRVLYLGLVVSTLVASGCDRDTAAVAQGAADVAVPQDVVDVRTEASPLAPVAQPKQARETQTISRPRTSTGTRSAPVTRAEPAYRPVEVVHAPQPRTETTTNVKRDALIGAGIGAAIGATVHRPNRVKGAIVGGVIGGAAGAVVGATIDKSTRVVYY